MLYGDSQIVTGIGRECLQMRVTQGNLSLHTAHHTHNCADDLLKHSEEEQGGRRQW